MTRPHHLVATASVHTTAAACDYLVDEGADRVTVLTVAEDGSRDPDDALNVATARLAGADVETVRAEGDPAEEILAAARERDVDRILLGAHAGAPGASDGVGSTARTVLAAATVPVVILPLPELGDEP